MPGVVERFKKELMYSGRRDKKSDLCREVAISGSSINLIDVDFFGESQFKFELYAMSFIFFIRYCFPAQF